jgi:hypothetical protein
MRFASSLPIRFGVLAFFIALTICTVLAAGPLAILPACGTLWAFIRVADWYGQRRRDDPSTPVWLGLVPVLSGIMGCVFPAGGYLAIVGDHPATRSEWPSYLWVLLPATSLGPTYPSVLNFFVLAFLNVALWLAIVPCLSGLVRLVAAWLAGHRAA